MVDSGLIGLLRQRFVDLDWWVGGGISGCDGVSYRRSIDLDHLISRCEMQFNLLINIFWYKSIENKISFPSSSIELRVSSTR